MVCLVHNITGCPLFTCFTQAPSCIELQLSGVVFKRPKPCEKINTHNNFIYIYILYSECVYRNHTYFDSLIILGYCHNVTQSSTNSITTPYTNNQYHITVACDCDNPGCTNTCSYQRHPPVMERKRHLLHFSYTGILHHH